jgi:hypothetical protein
MEATILFRIGSDPWRIDCDPVRASAVTRFAFLEISAPQDGFLASSIRVRFHAGRRRERGGTDVIENLRTHVLVNNRAEGNAPLMMQALTEMLHD